jgi:hypothetical protein
MTSSQRYIVEGIYNELKPLLEVDLTADQIKQLFATTQQNAGRTVIGKGVDAVSKVNQTIDNVGKWLQNTAPVQAADQKFEQLKSTIGQKFPELDKNLTAMGTWMKENPGKSAAIIGVLTTIAALGGGPAGGAIAGQILRGTAELLKGEKLSTAVGKGVKTAAFGFIAGKAFEMLGDWLGGLRADIIMKDRFADVSFDATKTMSGPGWEWTKNIQGVNVQVLPDDAQTINFLMDTIGKGGDQAVQAFDKLAKFAAEIRTPEYRQLLQELGTLAKDNDSLYNVIQGAKQGLQSISQGAIAASTGGQPAQQPAVQTQSVIRTGKAVNEYIDRESTVRSWALNESLGRSRGGIHLNEHGIETLFNLAVNEGPLDVIKKGAQAVGAKASQIGQNLTNKVTADKLNSAWVKAGSPTDSEKIAQVLKSAGVDDEVIKSSYGSMKLPAPNLPAKQPQASPAGKAAAAAVAGTMAATNPAAATAPVQPGQPAAVSSPAAQSTAQPTATQGGFWSGLKKGLTGQDTAPSQNTQSVQQPSGAQPAATDQNNATASGTSAEPVKPASVNDFAAKLQSDFEAFAAAGGSIGAPAMKRALKTMWMQAGGIRAESKKNKKSRI